MRSSISTKFGLITDVYSGGYKKCATYQNTMREVESSLMNLGTDYIDFYFVHWPDVNTPIDETMAALANLKKQGKIRFVGVSNFSEERSRKLKSTCRSTCSSRHSLW